MPADRKQRERALDPGRSFIVQAPAGSGKTEVLTQRFLKLLGTVDRPERVLAITFTRKATQEMRSRISKRLWQARTGEQAKEDHDRQAIALAARVLEVDQAHGWNLLSNPGRLRINTIDGLCMQLLARDPIEGAQWSGVCILDDARPLYREAVRRLFLDIDELANGQGRDGIGERQAVSARDALVRLLVHLGGDAPRLEALLVEMLNQRSLWRRHLATAHHELDALLGNLQAQAVASFQEALGRAELSSAMRSVARLGLNLSVPENEPTSELREAVALARLLCTAQRKPRGPGGINRRLFPEMEDTQAPALDTLKEIYRAWHEDGNARHAIERMASWPPLDVLAATAAEAAPESLLDDARTVLALALTELTAVMGETGQGDFTAISDAALLSLGDESAPADLLLSEDARIEHILMDEFQDTSYTQFRLLGRLTDGWQAGDGRSLFLVGDPMQSIYRFREANVGFFNEVVERGRLGQVPIESLALSSNFRSNSELIDWFNHVFPGVFPDRDESDSGAVSYTAVDAERGEGGAVELHAISIADRDNPQSARIAQLVSVALGDNANESIAVLVRTRRQVNEITAALSAAGIAFEAVDMATLAGRPVVQDLQALTRALLHPMDRVAWIALLRAPWCGLRVAEIHRVLGDDARREVMGAVMEALERAELEETLSKRLDRFRRVMSYARSLEADHSLARRVEMCWIQLGGPLACADAADVENAEVFLELLEEVEQVGDQEIIERLDEALEGRHASSRPARVQIMTIHNAKGLEFDVVLVPDLDRKPGSSRQPLIALQEFAGEERHGGVLMSAFTPSWMMDASLYRFLNKVDDQRAQFEGQRVLYVACTRARRRLHLLARVGFTASGKASLAVNSFLYFLQSPFRSHIETLSEQVARSEHEAEGERAEPPALPLLRLAEAMQEPDLPWPARVHGPEELKPLPNREAVALGTVLHQWLELIHDHPGLGWDGARIEQSAASIRSSLARAGASIASLNGLEARCLAILRGALDDDKLMALLGAGKMTKTWSELAIYRREGSGISRHVIDLLAMDASGTMKIIDYKSGTSGPDAGRQSARWAEQLERYREIVELLTGASVTEAKIHLLDNE